MKGILSVRSSSHRQSFINHHRFSKIVKEDQSLYTSVTFIYCSLRNNSSARKTSIQFWIITTKISSDTQIRIEYIQFQEIAISLPVHILKNGFGAASSTELR